MVTLGVEPKKKKKKGTVRNRSQGRRKDGGCIID